MDTNGTRFHLLLGETDWARATTPEGEAVFSSTATGLEWDASTREIRLRQLPFRFQAGKRDDTPTLDDRRGAAVDPYLNWYWISESEEAIRVQSSGEAAPSHFWSAQDTTNACPPVSPTFRPVTPPLAASARRLCGLAHTDDHYLVAGTLQPGGLLIFDLLGGGAPRELRWPVPFAPFDLAARKRGGVWILDRHHKRFWALDRTLRVIREEQDTAVVCDEGEHIFQPITGETRPRAVRTFPLGLDCGNGSPIDAEDPIAIDEHADGTVLVLDTPPTGHSRLLRYRFARLVEAHELEFRAHDFAVRDDQLTFAHADGNQALVFDLTISATSMSLTARKGFFPMRRFGGKALLNSVAGIHYDFGERWIPLVAQSYPRHETDATLVTRARRADAEHPGFDGREPQCVWHRLLIDACIPPGTAVEVWSRAADQEIDLVATSWAREPSLYRRSNGSELPHLPVATGRRGTFELLLQNARGRYLQLQLRLVGDGRLTPRLHALRVYYPRFSYLERYLPVVYRENAASASFLERFLANLEGTSTTIEDRIAAAQILFDVKSAPADTLDWLASWFGVALDPAWDERRSRLFLRHAMQFFQWRGTVHGLRIAIRLAFEPEPDESIFALGPACGCASGDQYRIVEKFRTRRIPAVQLGDPTAAMVGPSLGAATSAWTPNDGASTLDLRYQTATGLPSLSLVPLASEVDEAARAQFAGQTLGFVPSDPTDDINGWATYLQGKNWTGATTMPTQTPTQAELGGHWRAYQSHSRGEPYGQRRRLWQQFLVRRYVSVKALNEAHQVIWDAFDHVAYPVALPRVTAALRDWFEFESRVLPTLAAAHRFTVLLPVATLTTLGDEQRTRQLTLANRLIELEKPAHTTFDVKFFWALFRVGDARLGTDSVLGLGARDPAFLHQLAVAGRSYLGESFLSPGHPPSTTGRIITGRDRLPRRPGRACAIVG